MKMAMAKAKRRRRPSKKKPIPSSGGSIRKYLDYFGYRKGPMSADLDAFIACADAVGMWPYSGKASYNETEAAMKKLFARLKSEAPKGHTPKRYFLELCKSMTASAAGKAAPSEGPADVPYRKIIRKKLDYLHFVGGSFYKDLHNFMICANAIAGATHMWKEYPLKASLDKIANWMDLIFDVLEKRAPKGYSPKMYFFALCSKAKSPGGKPKPSGNRPTPQPRLPRPPGPIPSYVRGTKRRRRNMRG